MADAKAQIEASLEGAGQVASEAKKIEGALVGAGSSIEKKLGGALKGIGSTLLDIGKGALTAAGVFQTLNLSKAVEDVKRLDALTGQLSARTGTSSDSLQAGFGKLQQRILQSSLAQAEFSKSLGSVTYDAKFAIEALDGIGTHALASGRELGDELPLAHALQALGVDGRDTVGELDRVRAIAEQVGNAGGHLALQDSIGALSGLLQTVSTQSDAARGKLEGLLGVLGKGQTSPDRANQVRAATISMVRGRALDIERATGKRVLDDSGNLIDPTQSLQALRDLTVKKFGGNKEAARRALISDFGIDAGLAIMRGGFEQVDALSKKATSPSKTVADAERAKRDPANQRRAKDLAKESGMQEIARGAVAVDDAITGALGAKGAAAVETAAGLAAIGGAGKAAGAAAGAGKAAVGAGLSIPGAVVAAMAAPALGVLGEIGENRDVMGAKKRQTEGWQRAMGAELAARAQAQGGFSEDLFSKAGGDRGVMVEMLKTLDSRKDQLGPEFAQQVAAALAQELRRSPIQVRQEKDVNQSGGGN